MTLMTTGYASPIQAATAMLEAQGLVPVPEDGARRFVKREQSLDVLGKPDGSTVIGGYASVEIKDRERPIPHVISTEALKEAFDRCMAEPEYRNVMFAHSNVQVAKVLDEWESPTTGEKYESHVDKAGLYIIAEFREDIDAARKILKGVESGRFTSYSIAGEALDVELKSDDEGPYLFVTKMDIWEITICEAGKNPAATFSILKEEGRSLDGFTDAVRKSGEIVLWSPFMTLVGSLVKDEPLGDVDILIAGAQDEDTLPLRPVKFRVEQALDKAGYGSIQWIPGSEGGPFTSNLPVYELVLRPVNPFTMIMLSSDSLRALMRRESPTISNLRKNAFEDAFELYEATVDEVIESLRGLEGQLAEGPIKPALSEIFNSLFDDIEEAFTLMLTPFAATGLEIANAVVANRLEKAAEFTINKNALLKAEDYEPGLIALVRKTLSDFANWLTNKAYEIVTTLRTQDFAEAEILQELLSGIEDILRPRGEDPGDYEGDRSIGEEVLYSLTSEATNLGLITGYQEHGIDRVRVIDDHVGTSCEICEQIDGQTWSIDYAVDHLLEHPRCIRTFIPAS